MIVEFNPETYAELFQGVLKDFLLSLMVSAAILPATSNLIVSGCHPISGVMCHMSCRRRLIAPA